MKKTNNFTEGAILATLLKFSFPILLALFLQAMYGAVDLLVVGQFGDASGVSAVATGSQIMQTITGIITGLTMGTTVLLGQRIGERNDEGVAKTMGTSICLFAIIAIILTGILVCSARPLAVLMNAPVEAFEDTVKYVRICAMGTVFIVAYNVISGVFRGLGNSRLPLIFVAIACIVNILGDLLLVGTFQLNVVGAAIATILSQAVSVIISLFIIRKQKFPFAFRKAHIGFQKKETVQILQLGSPIALQDAMTNLSFLIITAILNSLGVVASAAVGVSEKLVVFIMLIPMSYMFSISAFTAQNVGAGKPERAQKAMFYGMATSLFFGVILFLMTFYQGIILAGLFSTDVEVIIACAEYMKAYAIDCMMVSILFCFMGYFNGCGKTVFVMAQGLIAAFCLRIPFSYFMSKVEGVTMFQLGLAAPLATALSIVLCIAYYVFKNNKIAEVKYVNGTGSLSKKHKNS